MTDYREIEVAIQLSPSLKVPKYQTTGAAGFDISASLDQTIQLEPGDIAIVSTGIKTAIPHGWEVQIRPRSGLACKHGVTVVNSPGTIDSDYRGEWKVALINLSPYTHSINDGDRIAQGVLSPCWRARFIEVEKIVGTERGEGGFGSTGR